MSMERRCRICGKKEDIRINFGDEHAAEKAFHAMPYFCSDECRNKIKP